MSPAGPVLLRTEPSTGCVCSQCWLQNGAGATLGLLLQFLPFQPAAQLIPAPLLSHSLC